MTNPERIQAPDPQAAIEAFRKTFNMPAPLEYMDAREDGSEAAAKELGALAREFAASVEAALFPRFRWAAFGAAELMARVPNQDAIRAGQRSFEHPWVCLVGLTREGKTSLASAMFRARCLATKVRGDFVPSYKLGLARLQHPAGRGEPEVVATAMTAKFLVLDDVGGERDNPTNAIPDIICERHDQDRPTWVTTGFTAKQMADRYGAGVARRLFEHATVIRTGRPSAPPPEGQGRARTGSEAPRDAKGRPDASTGRPGAGASQAREAPRPDSSREWREDG